MFAAHSSAVYDFLREQALVAPHELDELKREHEATGKPLADLAIETGLVDRGELLRRVASEFACDFLAEIPHEIPGEALATLTAGMACDYEVMPLRADARTIDLLLADPFDAGAIDDLTFALARRVRPFFGDPDKVRARIRQHYGEPGEDIEAHWEGLAIEDREGLRDGQIGEREIESLTEQRPIVAFVNLVLARAIRARASDIHFEPFEHEFKVRCRIDGVLHEMPPPPRHLARPIASRIKVLANLDIAERRVAQDGRIRVTVGGRAVDLRVSTLPTQFGESVVLRILDPSAVQLDLAQLGMPEDVRHGVEEVVRRPNGIFIVTGPTGCGKTTTLYGALRLINTLDLKLLTVEDPIEYEIEGIMQVPVNPVAGLTFASALRSFLRQDPDVVMVGEIRDFETAQIAIQASLTGHLVLTTLHTNDAPGAITRLIDMGVEPFLIASTLEAVLAQRLVRRVCPHCRVACQPDEQILASANPAGTRTRHPIRGRGCAHCGETGYDGRRGIYEYFRVTDELRTLVIQRAPTLQLRQQAIKQGMRTLRDDGLRVIQEGETTLEEVLKFT